MRAYISWVIMEEAGAIKNIPVTDDYEKSVELIYERVHVRKGKVVASGMGKAGQIALNIATTLSSTGTPSVFLHPSDSQHGDLGVIQENDLLLLVSNSGKTREILELVELAGRLHPGLPLIVITGNRESQLAAMADTHFSVEKGERDGRTYTEVRRLDRGQRRQELARLTGGSHVSQTMLDGAEELLAQAEAFRAGL